MILLYIWLLVLFVFLANAVRKDAIKEGVNPKNAWWYGLVFACLATITSVGLIELFN